MCEILARDENGYVDVCKAHVIAGRMGAIDSRNSADASRSKSHKRLDSVEARDRYFPAPDVLSEEAKRASEGSEALFEKLDTLYSSSFTDYVVIAQ